MKHIDFRSDTVTFPTPEMRQAVLDCPLGDDVYGDDPTVNLLEKEAAQLLGMEAAIFVPSGTFGNLLAVLTYQPFRKQVILSSNSHISNHEVGNLAALSRCLVRTVDQVDGCIPLDQLRRSIKTQKDMHALSTGLIYLENPTFSGKVLPLKYMEQAKQIADAAKLPIHLDGARFFNAVAKLKIQPKELAKYVDSVMICLSKGLCAPAGSLLLGRKQFIEQSRYIRKALGGGMRQAGVLAGPALISLRQMWKRLSEDNQRAADLGRRLSALGLQVQLTDICIVYVTFGESFDLERFWASCKAAGVVLPGLARRIRLMTHLYIDEEAVHKFAGLVSAQLA